MNRITPRRPVQLATLFSALAMMVTSAMAQDGIAQDGIAQNAGQPLPTLAELTRDADVVALIQVWDIEYEFVRNFPKKGITLVGVLIGYKGLESGETVEILEEGLKPDDGCYYPDRENEGHRFLAFLKRGPKGELRGTGPYCRLPVFVTNDNQYALLAPIEGVRLENESLEQTLDFADPHAFIDISEMSAGQVRELEQHYSAVWRKKHLAVMNDQPAANEDAFGNLLPPDDGLAYTRGVYLSDARRLMFDSPVQANLP